MSRPDDLRIIDAREYVIREQARFFRGGEYSPVECASMIALEVLSLGAPSVTIDAVGGWISVASTHDWIAILGDGVFDRLVPILGSARNEVSVELLPLVFSSEVVTGVGGEVSILKGASLGPFGAAGSFEGRFFSYSVEME